MGRPVAITNSVLQKLEMAFKIGATDREACITAEIAPQTLYNYQARNPHFLEQKEGWKTSLVLTARMVIVRHLERGDKDVAMRYLEKKCPEEFGRRKTACSCSVVNT